MRVITTFSKAYFSVSILTIISHGSRKISLKHQKNDGVVAKSLCNIL